MRAAVAGPATGPRALHAATGAIIADRLRVADTHWSRLRGLLGTRRLGAGDGLWITPCRQVHMLGMRYPIDVVFLDREGRVVRTLAGLAPWRISPNVSESVSVLELPAGSIERLAIDPGGRIAIEGIEARAARPPSAGAAGNLALAAFFLVFMAGHLATWRRSGQLVSLLAGGQYALLAALFAVRRPATVVSDRALDWTVGVAGLLLPLLLRPAGAAGPLVGLGRTLHVVGFVVATLAALSLGRSIGIVAANRGVRTGGLYAAVRHPLYLGEGLRCLGYLVAQPSLRNAAIVVGTLAALGARVAVEERLLGREPAYREYRGRVRWRFIPFVV